jgi:large subunit ribosomal protein L10
MPKTRVQKEEIISELSDKLGRMKSAVFTSISGYTMDDANALRAKGREQGVEMLVVKKTLLMRALEARGFKVDPEQLHGSILTTMGFDDEVAAAKIVAGFLKAREGSAIAGGILEGQFVGSDIVKHLATLPSKQELFSKLVGSFNAPVSGIVNVLAGNLRNFVYVLNAVKEARV